MWLNSGKASGRKTLLQYSSLTPLERECYEGEVQPYRKTDYTPIIYKYIAIILSILFPLIWWATSEMPSNSPPKFPIAMGEWATAKHTP